MDWQKTEVNSKATAFDLLWNHLGHTGLPPFAIEDYAEGAASHVMPIVWLRGHVGGIENEILHINMDFRNLSSGGGHVGELYVREDFRGKGIGHLGVKFILGNACEAGASSVEFSYMEECNADFLPSFGCCPAEAPTLAREISDVAGRAQDRLSDRDRALFATAIAIAQQNPLWGWRWLSQRKDLSEAGKEKRREIFWNAQDGRSVLLVPGEPHTHDILREKLGVIPAFRPLGAREAGFDIQQAFVNKPALAAAGLTL